MSTSPRTPDPEAVVDVLVQLADTMVDHFDSLAMMHSLVASCVELLGAGAAGLLLLDGEGRPQVGAASSEEARLLELLQLQHGGGPCLDCVRSGEAVMVQDVAEWAQRWPRFVEATEDAGFRAVYALPLRLRSETLGALNLFYGEAGDRPEGESRIARALTDLATISIVQRRAVERYAMLGEQLQSALQSRVAIEQAKGVVAAGAQVDLQSAFRLLSRYAREGNLRLAEVARAVVARELAPSELVRKTDPPGTGSQS